MGEAPHLRIVSEELWAKVQMRCEARRSARKRGRRTPDVQSASFQGWCG